jgi:hypothetical protein
MDLDAVGDTYHVWLDKVNLRAYYFLGRYAGPTSPTISPLTIPHSAPKMYCRSMTVRHHRSCCTIRNDYMRSCMPDNQPPRHSLLRAIMTDIHFWIPLCVLLGGFVLLDRLR